LKTNGLLETKTNLNVYHEIKNNNN